MSDVEDLDAMWRDGLISEAAVGQRASDPRARVAARVRHRRRVRRTMTAGGAAALTAATVVGVVQIGHGSSHVRVATDSTTTTTTTTTPAPSSVPADVVQVDEAPGNQLKIVFPNEPANAGSKSITLPSGLVRFVFHTGAAGHELRIDGVPGFRVDFVTEGATITKDVQLATGTHVMYCAIPGHREAGEHVELIVGN
jgi:hypothetical protein